MLFLQSTKLTIEQFQCNLNLNLHYSFEFYAKSFFDWKTGFYLENFPVKKLLLLNINYDPFRIDSLSLNENRSKTTREKSWWKSTLTWSRKHHLVFPSRIPTLFFLTFNHDAKHMANSKQQQQVHLIHSFIHPVFSFFIRDFFPLFCWKIIFTKLMLIVYSGCLLKFVSIWSFEFLFLNWKFEFVLCPIIIEDN